MFARRLNVLRSGGAFATAAAIVLILGSACKDLSDCLCINVDHYTVVARGANVVPAGTDTTPSGSATFVTSTLAWTYSVQVAPSGTIDSIALYQVAPRDSLPASATAILCAGATACAATSGTARVVAPATVAAITTSMRTYGTQLVFFTTTAQKAVGGAMRGTMYVTP